jgi:hypothetical protein
MWGMYGTLAGLLVIGAGWSYAGKTQYDQRFNTLQGGDPWTGHRVQKMLTHQQVALTSDLYGHATTESLRSIRKG